jgi:phosphoribosyl-ATP pyrophosphohydrolase/phosphoribosyl-AMP cyclohydrolase
MNVDFNKSKDGLVPAVIQDFKTNKVLMLGYMSKDSLSITLSKKIIHFYSRSKKRIWKKGEESFLYSLENVISDRKKSKDPDSYIANLFNKGLNKIAQKVGEEAVELVIESKDNNENLFLNESADLLFHYLILLQEKGFKLEDVVKVLKQRNKNN